jgi:dienelactone hydrolase
MIARSAVVEGNRMRTPRALLVWLFASISVASICQAAEPAAPTEHSFRFEPAGFEEQLPREFQLGAKRITATERFVDPSLTLVTFPSPVKSGHPPNDVVHAELYPPASGAGAAPARAVIFLHYLDGNLVLPRLFCRMFAQKGVAALLIKMPYYHERREGTDRRMLSPDATLTAAAVRQAALDVRYAYAYLASRKDVDRQRIGIAGISLGGIVGSLAFELEPRLERGCFLLAGADIPTMLWQSNLTESLRRNWEARGVTKADLERDFSLVDPASYPGRRAGRSVLLLSGRGDDTIPEACTKALARALGDPETVWFDGGHKPGASEIAGAMLRVVAFFSKRDK